MTAGEDRLVDPRTHGPVAARLHHAEHFTIASARHEIMMETDDLRALFWERFDRLARSVLGA
jgi:lysophospholipase